MDFSLIAGALSGITNGLTFARAAIEVRDFVKAGAAIADVMQKLLDLQTQVIASNGAFMELQKQHAALTQTVRELEEQAAERGRYELFELTPGVFVYRLQLSPHTTRTDNPGSPEPMHYLCPRCFDQKTKAILQLVGVHWHCVSCSNIYKSGLRESAPNYPSFRGREID
jgi:hypothetical protein